MSARREPAALLAELADLRLAATQLLDGTDLGTHGSRLPGAGFEFAQYRAYQPGDDLRFVDWKLFGRSDRYYVRESERETSIAVRVVLDTSASMRHADAGTSKWDVARLLAVAVLLLAERQGDASALVLAGDATDPALAAPARGRRHVDRLIHHLESLVPEGRWPAWDTLERALLASERRGVAVFLTDLHEHTAEITGAIARLAGLRHDVIVLHLVAPNELALPHGEAVAFEELETGRRVDIDVDAARALHAERVAADLERLRAAMLDAGAQYARVVLGEPLAPVLRAVLTARGGR